MTTDRFITQTGLLHTETGERLLYRILDIKLRRSLWQKIFDVGTITLYCADQSHGTCKVQNVKKPDAARKFLSKIVEQERTVKGITGREIYGAAAGSVRAASPPAAPAPAHDFVDIDGDGIPG